MKDITIVRKELLAKLEEKIGYTFKKKYILNRAVTHSSYANQIGLPYVEHNERLEFLGDSVLELIISEFIFKKYKNKPEGKLTKIRAEIVCESSLYEHSKHLGLGDYMLMGKGEEVTGGRKRVSILADAYEALIAAIYIDGGLENARKYILSEFLISIDKSVKDFIIKDYKSRLQENIQQNIDSNIKYEVVDEKGPAHDKTFYINVIIGGKIIGKGGGKSKKEAEQEAAKSALAFLGVVN